MTRTCYDEASGVGIDTAIATNYITRLTYAEGGANFYVLRPSVGGLDVRLPIGGFLPRNARLTVANHGTNTVSVKDVLGNVIATIAVNNQTTFLLRDNTVIEGLWLTFSSASSIGTTLVYDRFPLFLRFGVGGGTGVHLRNYVDANRGYFKWDGIKPVAIYCLLSAGLLLGSETQAEAALDTGTWPAGSTWALEVQPSATITGIGGAGGSGGSPSAPTGSNGANGGDAIITRVNGCLFNYGTIQGGGGGGGGGNYLPFSGGGSGGGGGGGGAGYQQALGGNGGPGAGPPFGNGQNGQSGLVGVGGVGGVGGNFGGHGGAPGAAGLPGNPLGGIAGATGNAIKRLSTTTFTQIVAGTIIGPQVTF